MPAEYQLRYLPVAQDDLFEIFDYIAQDNPTRAGSFVDRIDKAIGLLEAEPLLRFESAGAIAVPTSQMSPFNLRTHLFIPVPAAD